MLAFQNKSYPKMASFYGFDLIGTCGFYSSEGGVFPML
jgi:hypothetical protein